MNATTQPRPQATQPQSPLRRLWLPALITVLALALVVALFAVALSRKGQPAPAPEEDEPAAAAEAAPAKAKEAPPSKKAGKKEEAPAPSPVVDVKTDEGDGEWVLKEPAPAIPEQPTPPAPEKPAAPKAPEKPATPPPAPTPPPTPPQERPALPAPPKPVERPRPAPAEMEAPPRKPVIAGVRYYAVAFTNGTDATIKLRVRTTPAELWYDYTLAPGAKMLITLGSNVPVAPQAQITGYCVNGRSVSFARACLVNIEASPLPPGATRATAAMARHYAVKANGRGFPVICGLDD